MSRPNRIKERVKALFTFTKSERRGIFWLLPLLIVVGVLLAVANRPSFEKSFIELADKEDYSKSGDAKMQSNHNNTTDEVVVDVELFYFDPNTVTIQELVRLGISSRVAAGVIKYRERGKVFEIPEDFASCYGLTMENYSLLEPYIIIGDEFKVEPDGWRKKTSAEKDKLVNTSLKEMKLTSFDPNLLSASEFKELGFTDKQAKVIVNYRDALGGFETKEQFANCYAVSAEMMEQLTPYLNISLADDMAKEAEKSAFESPIEINSADSATLRIISGIGEVLVERIMEYRERLGGFAFTGQLAEVRGMTRANFERICKQIWVDSCEIKKININFASHKNMVEGLGNHPYVTAKMLRKLLKQRQLKGGWSKLGEMVEQDIVTQEEAERLAPYLLFE